MKSSHAAMAIPGSRPALDREREPFAPSVQFEISTAIGCFADAIIEVRADDVGQVFLRIGAVLRKHQLFSIIALTMNTGIT